MERDHKQEPRVPGEPVAGIRIEMPHPCCSSPVWVADSIGKRQSRIGRLLKRRLAMDRQGLLGLSSAISGTPRGVTDVR